MTDNHGFTPTEMMLDPTALAAMLRISLRHLTDLRRDDPTFPPPKMLGTLPRWSPAVIRRWMEGPAVEASAETTLAGICDAPAPKQGSKKSKGSARVH